MSWTRDDFTLTSGRVLRLVCGVVGIGIDCGATGRIFTGHDEALQFDDDDPHDDDFTPWTSAERAEVADEMIRRWQVFKIDGMPKRG